MKRVNWEAPITLEDPETGMVRTVTSARQAKLMLSRFWPAYHGSQYHRAEQVCAAALQRGRDPARFAGHSSPQRSRRIFI
ncbi:DUF982 domain-containing protein [Rhizobium sp. P32RR-XVIII]|uniref:DUF982 domain-containing protein n=1 Tax=Rhizobium sp. P32RR-XVIII TaxID=2726738 RepID=UPI0014574006|nr:DUF982 domain-containing protein [Rhizobium sp. P32RR-XVIII]NLS03272.1 DUF982 domain-containing protein [Rhizobium sp. P32RR-XVIII]